MDYFSFNIYNSHVCVVEYIANLAMPYKLSINYTCSSLFCIRGFKVSNRLSNRDLLVNQTKPIKLLLKLSDAHRKSIFSCKVSHRKFNSWYKMHLLVDLLLIDLVVILTPVYMPLYVRKYPKM